MSPMQAPRHWHRLACDRWALTGLGLVTALTVLALAAPWIAPGRGAPWMSLVPGLAIGLTVLGINLLGDGLRDALEVVPA